MKKTSQELRKEIQEALKSLTATKSPSNINRLLEICTANNTALKELGEDPEPLTLPEKPVAPIQQDTKTLPEPEKKAVDPEPKKIPRLENPEEARKKIREALAKLAQTTSEKKKNELLDICLEQNWILSANGHTPEPLQTPKVEDPKKPANAPVAATINSGTSAPQASGNEPAGPPRGTINQN
jgi:hypothetical protein